MKKFIRFSNSVLVTRTTIHIMLLENHDCKRCGLKELKL